MTLEVGIQNDEMPIVGSLSVSGKLDLAEQLFKGDDVIVTIADADGAVITRAYGFVQGVGFTDHKTKALTYTERRHKIKLKTDDE
jgi:hypothetical protein